MKSMRLAKGLSQDALADLMGVTKTQISDIEREKVTTTIERLCAFAEIFNVSTDYLLGLSNDPKRHE